MKKALLKDSVGKVVRMTFNHGTSNYPPITLVGTINNAVVRENFDEYSRKQVKKLQGYLNEYRTGEQRYFNEDPEATCFVLSPSELNRLAKPTQYKLLMSQERVYPRLGADPEIFIVDENDEVIPAFNFLKSKKENPRYFWDGFQAEFTTEAKTCLAYTTDGIQGHLNYLLGLARAFNKNAHFTYKSVIDIPREVLYNTKQIHAEFGCMPSLNVYNEEPLVVPDPYQVPIRFAGFHIHFGFKEEKTGSYYVKNWNDEKLVASVKWLDRIAGIMSVSVFQGLEDYRRRKFYGKAGEYRLPKHGLEYRTLSSAMFISPVLIHLIWDFARIALMVSINPELAKHWVYYSDDKVRNIINNYDIKDAKALLKLNEGMIKGILHYLYHNEDLTKSAFHMMMEGAFNYFDVTKIEENWYLGQCWPTHCGNVNACVGYWKATRII